MPTFQVQNLCKLLLMLAFKDPDITNNIQHYCETLQDLQTAIKREVSHLAHTRYLHAARQCLAHCPGHVAVHALEGVGLSLIQTRSIFTSLPCVWPPQEVLNNHRFRSNEEIKAMVVQWFQQQSSEFSEEGIR